MYLVVFTDDCTKWPEAFSMSDKEASMVAQLLVKQVITCHGAPESIVTDRGGQFTSALF